MIDEYHSVIYYHVGSPKWSETVKVCLVQNVKGISPKANRCATGNMTDTAVKYTTTRSLDIYSRHSMRTETWSSRYIPYSAIMRCTIFSDLVTLHSQIPTLVHRRFLKKNKTNKAHLLHSLLPIVNSVRQLKSIRKFHVPLCKINSFKNSSAKVF